MTRINYDFAKKPVVIDWSHESVLRAEMAFLVARIEKALEEGRGKRVAS